MKMDETTKVEYYKGWNVNKWGKVEGVIKLSPDKLLYEHTKLCYDSSDKMIELLEYKKDESPLRRTFSYHPQKNVVVQSMWYDKEGNWYETHKYHYDESGILVKGEAYDTKGVLQFYICSKYGDNGELEEESWHYKDGRLGGRNKFVYDSENNVIEEVIYDKDNTLRGKFKYKYDNRKNMIEKQWFDSNNKLQTTFNFEYDSRGNQTRITLTKGDTVEYTKIEYDEIGNKATQDWSKDEDYILHEEEPDMSGEDFTDEEKVNQFLRGEKTLSEFGGISQKDLFGMAEIGYAYFEQGKFDTARAIFEGLTALNPNESYFHAALGAISRKENKLGEALKEYNLAVELDPDNIYYLANRGEVLLAQQKVELALNDFNRVILIDPELKSPITKRTGALVATIAAILEKSSETET